MDRVFKDFYFGVYRINDRDFTSSSSEWVPGVMPLGRTRAKVLATFYSLGA